MTDNDPTTGLDLSKQPHKSIIKRIDIGLTTGLCALLISFVGILTSRATFKMNQETQKTRVLPIIDIDMGYEYADDHRFFAVKLNNVGAGIAHIQSVTPTIHGDIVAEYQAFEDAVMNRRMRGWSTLTEKTAAGYLRAGGSVTPRHYRFSKTNSEIDAYLRGQYGKPFDGLDISACYCSVFEDCWTVSYVDRKTPKPVNDCGVSDAPNDLFQTYIVQRTEVRSVKEEE